MKTQTLFAFLALAASLQQVSGWSDAPAYKCPENSCDKCTSQQSSGFDWSDLAVGDFSFYGGFDFEGFTSSNSFAKQNQLTARDFQSKCITGSASSELESCPKASCSDVSSFSIDTIEISVEFDVELEFQYGMDDGSTCKQKCSCSFEGTSVKNTQCGGARNFTIVLPTPPPSKPTCSIGIYSIGFHCPSSCSSTTQTTSTHVSYTSPTVVSTTTPVMTTPSSTLASVATTSAASSSAPITARSSSTTPTPTSVPLSSSLASSSAASSPVSSSSTPASRVASSFTSASTATSSLTPTSSAASSSTASLVTSSASQYIATVIVDTTVTTCPVTNIHTTGGTTSTEITQTVSILTTTYTSTVCTRCKAPATSMMSASSAQSSVSCPLVLPSCLNTWMSLVTDCSSIDDYKCFCPISNLTAQVFACISAHGASDSEISAAQIYFQGICAEYVPQNLALVTAASSLTATATVAGSVTTINVYTTVIVPGTQSNGPASTTTTISSAVTVPQVVLTAVTGTVVGIYQGTQAPFTTTAAAAIATTIATMVSTNGAANSTSTTSVGLYQDSKAPLTTTAAATVATTIPTMIPSYGVANSTGTTTAAPPKFTGAASQSSVAFSVVVVALVFSFFAL